MAKRAQKYKETWERRRANLPTKTYKEFLNSDYWKRIKKKAKSRINYQRCEFCGCMDNLELHHKHYDFIGNEHELSAIIAVCRQHHQFIHDYSKLKDVSVFRATKVAYTLFEKWRVVPKSMNEYREIIKRRNRTDIKFTHYLSRNDKPSMKAHVWDENTNDTACKMWSTGGIKSKEKYSVKTETQRNVCKVCLNNLNQNEIK